jgi:ATP-binding cassette, subfamily C (CFTR/MRP), member 1
VVLDDHGIVAQGKWQKIQMEATSPAKFSSTHGIKDNAILSGNFEKLNAQLRAKDETEVDLARQSGDPALYGSFPIHIISTDATNTSAGYYLGFIDFVTIFILVACTASYSFFITIPQYWLRLWTELGGSNPSFYIGGYLFLSFMSWSSTSTLLW